jgi:hypothetical protein
VAVIHGQHQQALLFTIEKTITKKHSGSRGRAVNMKHTGVQYLHTRYAKTGEVANSLSCSCTNLSYETTRQNHARGRTLVPGGSCLANENQYFGSAWPCMVWRIFPETLKKVEFHACLKDTSPFRVSTPKGLMNPPGHSWPVHP